MNRLAVIAGPTACGKTDAAVMLAERINGEIISADSMQVYKYMDIGTAKPTQAQMKGIKHYLIDEIYPDDEYSVAHFAALARKYAREIYGRGKTPILVGGTGFYISAFINGTEFTETDTDTELRARLYKIAEEQGSAALFGMLRERDPEACESIHPNNIKRVVRAIEFYEQTGQKISEHNREQKQKTGGYGTTAFILNMPREKLYARIDSRVDGMMRQGLAGEVKSLLERGYSPSLTSMQGLGYKELIPCVTGGETPEQAAETLKRSTRRFAKRQLTWFRHQPINNSRWINIDEFENMDIMVDILARCL